MSTIFIGKQPQNVLQKFWDISQVYCRGADHCEGVSKFMVEFGENLGLETIMDSVGNVIIKKPATAGYEQAPVIMLASHMDMIFEKNPGVEHDFYTEPLKLLLADDNDTIYADGTTLGADNGIGVAFVMAVLESDCLAHPAIEAVFTVNEETDMKGAWQLDYSKLKSKIILSLDAARLSLGGSGELEVEMELAKTMTPSRPDDTFFTLSISGLLGGHSGNNAYSERGNAVTLLCRILIDLREKYQIRIVSYKGGDGMSSALAREAGCTFGINKQHLDAVQNTVKEWAGVYVSEMAVPDPGIKVLLTQAAESYSQTCDDKTTDQLLTLLNILPDGIVSLHKYFQRKVESCVNVGVVETKNDHFWVTCLIRSAVATKKYFLLGKIQRICKLLNVPYKIGRDLPQWDYVKDSRLSAVIKDIYSDLEPNIGQGTFELGIFLKHMPGAEAAGIGTIVDTPHSPNEKLSISAVQDNWSRFIRVLEALKEY